MQIRRRHKRPLKKAAGAEATTVAAAQAVATVAAAALTAALTAAADGKTITKHNAEAAGASEASEVQETEGKDKEIPALIQQRKTTAKHEKERIREISKKIKKCIRKKGRTDEKNQKILEGLTGTRNILSTKSAKRIPDQHDPIPEFTKK